METENIQLKTLVSAIALILIVESIGARIVPSDAMTLPAIGIVRLLEIVGLVLLVFLFEKKLSCIGLYRSGMSSAFRKGIIWSVCFGLLAGGATLVLFLFGIHPLGLIRVQLPSNVGSLLLYFTIGGVIGPAAEELFFRGLVFRFFRRWGFAFSLCFTTVIFAALHPMSSGVPIPQIVGGLLFATAFEIEKNLLVPTLIHVLGNLAIFSFSIIT